jgi:hypothetical protein
MKKVLKIIAIVLAISFIAIQFYRPARINVPIVEAETLEATTQVPENVQEILKRSCNDCHTNQTDWIWYSNIAPISWGMVDHVNDGRNQLNFSKWGTYSPNRKDHKLDEICEQVEIGEMPHYQYLWLHWNAELSKDDVKILCDWTKNEKAKITPEN